MFNLEKLHGDIDDLQYKKLEHLLLLISLSTKMGSYEAVKLVIDKHAEAMDNVNVYELIYVQYKNWAASKGYTLMSELSLKGEGRCLLRKPKGGKTHLLRAENELLAILKACVVILHDLKTKEQETKNI